MTTDWPGLRTLGSFPSFSIHNFHAAGRQRKARGVVVIRPIKNLSSGPNNKNEQSGSCQEASAIKSALRTTNKKLCYHRRTARRDVSVKTLRTAAQQSRNNLYNKSRTNGSYNGVRRLQYSDV